jgi:hypothetical protein
LPPVHTAIFYHNPGIVKRMLELGANPNLKDSEGRTALQVAELFASTGGLDHDGSTLLRVLVFVARIFNWRHFREVRLRMGEISKLLRQHGAK